MTLDPVIPTVLPADLVPDAPVHWARVELTLDLPMLVHVSPERWVEERIGALTMYCCDGRWGDAFDEFCHRCLHIPRYDRLAVPGGPACLVRTDSKLAEAHRVAREQFDFLVRAHELDRVVLITHHGCAFYRELLRLDADASLSIQIDDVRAAADVVRSWHTNIRVETYLAMREGDRLTFRTL